MRGPCLYTVSLVACVIAAAFTLCYCAKPKLRGGLENSPLTEVRSLEGKRVMLPCEVAPPIPGDDVILVLFYRGALGTPIYSIDGRNGPVQRAQHWADEDTLQRRAYFDLTSPQPGLVLHPVTASDEDEYRCRVDFKSSPTRNVRVNLKVIVPPKKIRLVSEAGLEVSGLIGPYHVGATLTLQCHVEGGRPAPSVTWWSESVMLDDVVEEQKPGANLNTLTLPALTRGDLYRVLTCKASNSNLSVPLAAAVTMDMSFPPLEVRILGRRDGPYSEGQQYKLVCESSGSRPSATITWWKDGMLMTDTRNQVFQEGNVSRSTLHLTPTLADHDIYISCRAVNPLVTTAVMEDSTKLNVYYTPRLSLAAGNSLNMDDIKEGDDVYFECGIKANPSIYKVQWFHNGEEITHNVSAGIIQSNQSLVLQRLTKTSSGQYTCAASNIHGRSGSNAVQLSVKFSPLCRPGQTLVFGAAKNEQLNITCSVEAHPEPTSFRWAFNSSSEVVDIPAARIRSAGKSRSQVSYVPTRHQDYGSLLCWATNDVGVQRQPCIYHVIHASPPDPVNNCTVENISSSGVGVRCQAGWDGGLAQTFTLSVTHARAHTRTGHHSRKAAPRVLANTSTAPRPEFALSGLEPGTEYLLTIMGVNNKGQSEPVRIAVVTLKDVAEKRTSPVGSALALTSLLGVVLGVLASLLVMAAVVVALVRRARTQQKPEVKMVYHKGAAGHHLPDEVDDSNPDVIPVNDDHQVQQSAQQTKQQGQQQHPGQQQQQEQHHALQQTAADVDAAADRQPPAHLDLYGGGGHVQTHLGHEGSFYINPGTLLRQGGIPGREQDPLSLVGGPLAASTPTAATPNQAPMYCSPHLTSLPLPPYQCEAVPYTQQGTPTYPREVSFVPISSAYPQDLHTHPEAYPQDHYTPDLPCLPPPYPTYSLSLGRDGRIGPQQSPGCLPPGPHPLGPPPHPEALGTPTTSPWDGSSERRVSPGRESSV
ncbi:nephrin-like isoform X2 [Eriocheir sinensis]|nr:nephrin-like isoform X2 [Eriocheir sinensis]XP_050721792.1 nephrin-like isoform X2 [Eriocheir sinensis]